MAVVKISTLLLYARIFPGQTFKYVLWATGLFVSTYSTALIIILLLQCRPLSKVWDNNVNGKCIEADIVWMVMGSLNVLTDLVLLALPLPSLWRLQMPRRTKVQVAGIFSIGSLSVTRSRKFNNGLTDGLRPTDSLSFRSIESRRCTLCLGIHLTLSCTHMTLPGSMSSPNYGRPLKLPLLSWALAPSPTDLCSSGSLRIGSQ